MINIDFLPIFLIIQKIFFIACSIFYLIFALVVVKQVSSMSKNVKDKFNPILISFSFIHLVFAIFLIFIVIVWL